MKGELVAGMLVNTPLIEKIEVYGFISYVNSKKTSFSIATSLSRVINLNESIILADRIAFRYCDKDVMLGNVYAVHPVFKKIRYSISSEKLLFENLYVLRLELDDVFKRENKYNKTPTYYTQLRNRKLSPESYPMFGDRYGIQTIIEDDKLYYPTQPNDILMYKKSYYPNERVSAVGTEFLVIGRYINSVTGKLSHRIYFPEELSCLED